MPRVGDWPANESGVRKPSVRPSAFGIPRASSPPPEPSSQASDSTPAPRTSDVRMQTVRSFEARLQTAPRTSDARVQSTHPSVPASTPPAPLMHALPPLRRNESDPWPAIKTDIEQLLPISHGVRSLPRPPRMPSFDASPQPVAATRRVPWASVAVFAMVMAGSIVTLVRYSDRSDAPLPRAQAESVGTPSTAAVPSLVVASSAEHRRDAIRHIENTFAGDADRIGEALLDEGERALESDDERLAEALFARAYELEHDTGRATYGLARVRLAQGNLEGAEGWVQIAIRAHPGRAAYHTLYASVLERWGRLHEAQLERSLARSLANATVTSDP